GRGKEERIAHCGIQESLLDESLAVIKRSFHFERGNIATECRELLFLDVADLSGRIQDHHTDTIDAEKAVGNRAPCVTRCSHEDHDLPLYLPREEAEQLRHE